MLPLAPAPDDPGALPAPLRSDPKPNGSDPAPARSDRDEIPKWTIKGIGPEARNAAIRAAERADMTIGEWISRAIRMQIKSDRASDPARVPVRLDAAPSDPAPATDPTVGLDAVERILALAQQIAAASGRPPPRRLFSAANRLLRERLEQLRAGPTVSAPGPTDAGESSTDA